jgi:hypothetical protein
LIISGTKVTEVPCDKEHIINNNITARKTGWKDMWCKYDRGNEKFSRTI